MLYAMSYILVSGDWMEDKMKHKHILEVVYLVWFGQEGDVFVKLLRIFVSVTHLHDMVKQPAA